MPKLKKSDLPNKKSLLKKIHTLYQFFQEGQIPTLAQHEVHPDLSRSSRENYLYFTLAPSLNFQRNSPALWVSALKTYEDPATNYLFFPEQVVSRKYEEIQADLLKHKLALQKNKHPAIWTALAETFHRDFQSDPRELLKACDYDVLAIQSLLQKKRKKDFPYLSGPKMTNYWMYILSQYTDVVLKNRGEISIIPDTHVIQSTKVLGLSDQIESSLKTAELWKELLQDSSLDPVDMHPVLWNWSRNQFAPTP